MEFPFFTTGTGGGGGGGGGSSSNAVTRAEALRWLAIAEKLLAGRDLVGSKSFATRARESDPTLLYADQIIAVADTLLAGDNRINNLPDWYSVLQLTPEQSRDGELIAGQYRKLALLLNPQKNKLPFSDQAFALVVTAWQVLSNPSRKNMYDNELMSQLRLNQLSSGFNSVSSWVTREQVNYQPFEINFQVMPQHAMNTREQVMQPQQLPPQMQPQQLPPQMQQQPQLHPSQMLPQQNLTQEYMSQPQPQPQPWGPPAPPQPQLHPQGKEILMGNDVTRDFSAIGGNVGSNNNNNGNDGGGVENVDDGGNVNLREAERRRDEISEDGVLSFWTACPYCYYMYEYPIVYAECTLRCQNCRKAFQGVEILSPPPSVDGEDAYFCCWGLMPLGVSMEVLKRNKGMGGKWTPFSPMFNGMVKKSSGPRFYKDDEDAFLDYSSDSREDSDDGDWRTGKRNKKAKGVKKTAVVKNKASGTPGKRGRPPKVDKGRNLEGRGSENVQEGLVVQEGVEVPNAPLTESSKKVAATNTRRRSARFANGKLDLNVEFNSEVEEPAPRVIQGNGTGRGEEDIVEGSGFFEGLDEFLSTLPILNVVGGDKVKAA